MNRKQKAAVASGGPAKLSCGSVYQERSPARTHSPLLAATRTRICPACGGADWCSIAADGAICICMRVEAGSLRPTRNGGFLHLLGGASGRRTTRRRTFRTLRTVYARCGTAASANLGTLATTYHQAAEPAEVAALADALGITAESLDRLNVGWAFDAGRAGVWDAGDLVRSSGTRVWAFPMVDACRRVVGLRLRTQDGRKYAVGGGREGLFLPAGLTPGETLFVTEGPTDCAALLDLGLNAVGRPSCTGGKSHLITLLRSSPPDDVVVVADADAPGRRGAESLANVLTAYAGRVRLIAPPPGVKDARAWKQAGATAADVLATVACAPLRRLAVCGQIVQGRRRRQGVRHGS